MHNRGYFSILCKSCNCKRLIAAYCPGKGIVVQNFDSNFICASIAIMKILVLRIKKCLFLRCLSLFIYFHTYITHLSSKEFKIKGAMYRSTSGMQLASRP